MPLDRRTFLGQAVLASAGLLGFSPLRALAADAPSDPALLACRPEDPLQALLAGNSRFMKAWAAADAAADPADRARILSALWSRNCYTTARVLQGGQAPWAAVLACADSRVAPEWIFDAALSDLFVIRSAGNTAFDEAIASLEYAVSALGTELVLVMGHSSCGAVRAALSSDPLTPLLRDLVAPIRSSVHPGEDLTAAIKANARHAAAEIPRRSVLLAEAVSSGRLAIQSGYFDIASGQVSLL